MNLFGKRPLGLILCIFLCGFAAFALCGTYMRIALFAALAIAFACVLVIPVLRRGLYVGICFALLTAYVLAGIYFGVYFYPNEYDGETVDAEVIVTSIEQVNDHTKALDVKTLALNDRKASYRMKAYVFGYSDDIEVGDVLLMSGKLDKFDSEGSFDFISYYTARGFSARLSSSTYEIQYHTSPPLSYRMTQIRKSIAERAISYTDEDTGGFIAALLLGERDLLSPKLELDFTRIGIVHILSLSGMHLAILVKTIDKLLAIMQISKRYRSIAGSVFSLLFMAITGFPITIVRAGVMLIISSVLTLISGNKDGITSLSLASVIIVIANPHSVFDIGFWLSVLSTAGIIMAAEFSNVASDYTPKATFWQKAYKYVILSLTFSLFAIFASILITAFNFEGFSVVSVFTTLIFSPLTELLILIGTVTLIFGGVIKIGGACIWIANLISSLASAISDMRFVYVSSSFIAVKVLAAVLGITFIIFLLLKLSGKKYWVLALCVLYVAMNITAFTLTERAAQKDAFVCVEEDGTDMILITGEETVLFDSGNHRRDAGYAITDRLSAEGICMLDTYLSPTITATLPDMLEVLCTRISVRKCIIPEPTDEEQEQIYGDLYSICKMFDIEILTYSGNRITLGEYEYVVAFRRSHREYGAIFRRDDTVITYLTSGILASDNYDAHTALYASDAIIFGSYGEGYGNGYMIDDFGNKIKVLICFDLTIKTDEEYLDERNVTVVKFKRCDFIEQQK